MSLSSGVTVRPNEITEQTAMNERQGYHVPSAGLSAAPGPGLCGQPPPPPAGLSKVMELPVSTCFITKLLTEETPHNNEAPAPPLTPDP